MSRLSSTLFLLVIKHLLTESAPLWVSSSQSSLTPSCNPMMITKFLKWLPSCYFFFVLLLDVLAGWFGGFWGLFHLTEPFGGDGVGFDTLLKGHSAGSPHTAISTTFKILSTTGLICHSCHKFILSPDSDEEFSDSSSQVNKLVSLQTINFGPCLAERHDPRRQTKLGSHIRAVYVCSAVQNMSGKKVQDLHHLRSAALLG